MGGWNTPESILRKNYSFEYVYIFLKWRIVIKTISLWKFEKGHFEKMSQKKFYQINKSGGKVKIGSEVAIIYLKVSVGGK